MTAHHHTALKPFIRRGRPVPLTAGDYARRAQLVTADARATLRHLTGTQFLAASRPSDQSIRVYELTRSGIDALAKEVRA